MPLQTFDPTTKTQTTYNGEDTSSGIAKVETVNNGVTTPVSTPAADNTAAPISTPLVATKPNITLASGQVINSQDPNYDNYASQNKTEGSSTTPSLAEVNAPGYSTPETIKATALIDSVKSGNPMDEATAKEYALSRGEANWQKYVNGVNGNLNPNYIGAASFAQLQKQYTPYQIDKATIRTKDGIYWNPSVNIGEVPSTNPGDSINKFAKDIAGAVESGKKKEDILAPKGDATGSTDTSATDTTGGAPKLDANSTDLNTGIGIYNTIMNTPGMDDLKADVTAAKSKVDAYDQQMDELADDIRKEVEGEAPESYINALAAVRGNSIMKLRRAAERDYNTATANFNAEKELKTNQINMLVNDANNRYNRAFQNLQFQETQATNAKAYEATKLNAMLSIPEGKSYTFKDGTVVNGLKENDNIATGTYTDANGGVYYYGVDKKTGKEAFPKTRIGTAPKSGGSTSASTVLANYKAGQELTDMAAIQKGLKDGTLATGYDNNGKEFYYDKNAYEEAAAADLASYDKAVANNSDWNPFTKADQSVIKAGTDKNGSYQSNVYKSDFRKY